MCAWKKWTSTSPRQAMGACRPIGTRTSPDMIRRGQCACALRSAWRTAAASPSARSLTRWRLPRPRLTACVFDRWGGRPSRGPRGRRRGAWAAVLPVGARRRGLAIPEAPRACYTQVTSPRSRHRHVAVAREQIWATLPVSHSDRLTTVRSCTSLADWPALAGCLVYVVACDEAAYVRAIELMMAVYTGALLGFVLAPSITHLLPTATCRSRRVPPPRLRWWCFFLPKIKLKMDIKYFI